MGWSVVGTGRDGSALKMTSVDTSPLRPIVSFIPFRLMRLQISGSKEWWCFRRVQKTRFKGVWESRESDASRRWRTLDEYHSPGLVVG